MLSAKKIALLAVVGAFAVAPAAASASNTDKSTGGGTSPGNAQYQQGGVAVPFSFSFTAQNSAAPKGNFTFTRFDGSFTATVTCYSQSSNQGAFSGPITSGTGQFTGSVGQYAYFGVQDNGEGSNATAPDAIQVDTGAQYTGACPISSIYPYQLDSGNIQVHQGS